MFMNQNQQKAEYMNKTLSLYKETYNKLLEYVKDIKSSRADREENIINQKSKLHEFMFAALGHCMHNICYASEDNSEQLESILSLFQGDLEKITRKIVLDRNELLEYLRTEIKPKLDNAGAINLALFGSVARNEYDEESDIDICYEATDEFKQKYPNLTHLQFIGDIRNQISLHFERKVDIICVKAMNEFMLESVMRDIIYV